MTRFPTIAVLSLLAATAGCKRPETPPKAPPVAPPSASAPAIVAAPTPQMLEQQAFQAAWGAPPPVRRTMPDASRMGAAMIYGGGDLVPLGEDRYAFISPGKLSDASHVDSAALSIHYLKRTAAGFTRTGAWPEFLADGTTGEPPTWKVRADLTAAPAILTEAGGVWQGYACTWSHLIELAPEGPVLRTDLIPVDYDSSGAKGDEGAEHMEGSIMAGQKGRSFVVRYTGDRRTTVTYSLSGAKYEPATKPDLLTC